MDHRSLADQYHGQGYGCAQSVLAAFAPEYGLSADLALRLGTGLGGGMGRMGEVCGALTGAFLVIGLGVGKGLDESSPSGASTAVSYRLVAELASRFRERHGAVLCRELLECDLMDPVARQRAAQAGLFAQRCTGYILEAVDLLEDLLAQEARGASGQ